MKEVNSRSITGLGIRYLLKSLFDITVDVLWADFIKKEDDAADRFAAENG